MRPPDSIAVLICTYKRPDDLLRCLVGLRLQTRPADDIMIVARPDDLETHTALTADVIAGLPVRVLPVTRPGLIAARNVGIESCHSDVLVMTDDDTVAHPDWLNRILDHFVRDPAIGGVGGRDRCLLNGNWDERHEQVVGTIAWFGRKSGYHHLGFGEPRFVHVLKGANMSFRMDAVGSTRADSRLRGRGAQAHEDAMFSLAIRRKGWKLLYDPAVLIDHFEGSREEARHYGGIAPITDPEAFKEGPYNWVLNLWDELSTPQHFAFVIWNFLIGTRVAPGLAQAFRFTPSLGAESWYRFWITQVATYEAYRTLCSAAFRMRRKDELPSTSSSN